MNVYKCTRCSRITYDNIVPSGSDGGYCQPEKRFNLLHSWKKL